MDLLAPIDPSVGGHPKKRYDLSHYFTANLAKTWFLYKKFTFLLIHGVLLLQEVDHGPCGGHGGQGGIDSSDAIPFLSLKGKKRLIF